MWALWPALGAVLPAFAGVLPAFARGVAAFAGILPAFAWVLHVFAGVLPDFDGVLPAFAGVWRPCGGHFSGKKNSKKSLFKGQSDCIVGTSIDIKARATVFYIFCLSACPSRLRG